MKRPGRPSTPGKVGEKSTLSIRATADLKDRLTAEANRTDRSLSQEAEFRLEQSFQRDDAREILDALKLSLESLRGQVTDYKATYEAQSAQQQKVIDAQDAVIATQEDTIKSLEKVIRLMERES